MKKTSSEALGIALAAADLHDWDEKEISRILESLWEQGFVLCKEVTMKDAFGD